MQYVASKRQKVSVITNAKQRNEISIWPLFKVLARRTWHEPRDAGRTLRQFTEAY